MASRGVGLLVAWVGLQGTLACAPQSDGALPDSQWLLGADPQQVLASTYCGAPQPGDTPLRRLSNLEYENTLLDLGFEPTLVASAVETLPPEPESLGFRTAASALTVTSLMAEKYKAIAQQLTANYAYPCELDDESACADRMIQHAGARIYRRPLTSSEVASHRALYDQARQLSSHDQSLGWVARAMLQSPHFLYRVELPDEAAVVRVRDHEMANRLSYLLWQAPPDEDLRRAADAGLLGSEDEVVAQAARMLQDPRAKNVLQFFEQWLDLDDLHEVKKEGAAYAGVSARLAPLLRAEAQAFLLHLLRTPGASYQDLLTADFTFANAELAEHYGLAQVEGDAFVQVLAPGRRGVLTQGMLVAQDGPTRTSIVRRGLKVRTDFLCHTVPAPPDTVDLTLDGIGEELTQSERLALHSKDASCSGCHRAMDPIGRVFEEFDAVGRPRSADEHGNPVEVAGELTLTLDADGTVEGVAELAERLAESTEAQQCYMIQNLRFFLGREVEAADLCTQAQVFTHWQEHDLSLVELLMAIVRSDAFLYKARKEEAPTEEPNPESNGDVP